MPILRQIAQLGQPILREVAGKIADPADVHVAYLQPLICFCYRDVIYSNRDLRGFINLGGL
ncbi:MAG: hypothetical protein A2X80_11395 [Geobacteraceae bacterium GWB2_52_12]|nr:MAG: hypothetical protein A2X80_11395 [Geobacteraceae bacterium GWB2_52_12]